MAITADSFTEFVQDQLQDLKGVRLRRMFGGYGLYFDTTFFGILHRERLYFRTDSASREQYRARGMSAFRPHASQTLRSYYELPPDVLEDAEELVKWAQRAISAARQGATSGKTARRASRRKPAGTRRVRAQNP